MRMNIPAEIEDAERRIKAAGQSVEQFCAAANINRATWQRWKSGASVPNLETWTRAKAALPGSDSEQSDAA